MATIAFFQNRLGRTDGVSLEVDKWRSVLEQKGHTVYYISGNDDVQGNIVIPELYAGHPWTAKILKNATVAFQDYLGEAELEQDIYLLADVLEAKILDCIATYSIDVLIPNNLCSGGYQPAAAIAFHRVIRKTGLQTIIHSHDFYFEDSGEVNATCQSVASIYERYFPSKLPNVQHVFINRIAQSELKKRKQIDGMVIPNVFDFNQESWKMDSYNSDLRECFGISPDDLVFLQATRILDRKGVELAIDTIAELQKPKHRKKLEGVKTTAGGVFNSASRIILLCAGIVETIGISGAYWKNLQDKAAEMKVDMRHVGDSIAHTRSAGPYGKKIYSLWDSYVAADFVTYPSIWEGWGNQFIEALFAKLPVLLFEYPVYASDLADKQFKVISLGSKIAGRDKRGLVTVAPQDITRSAEEIIALFLHPELRKHMVEHNYSVASAHYSMENLAEHIDILLKKADI
jgi:mannosylglucosylglycerate synthase